MLVPDGVGVTEVVLGSDVALKAELEVVGEGMHDGNVVLEAEVNGNGSNVITGVPEGGIDGEVALTVESNVVPEGKLAGIDVPRSRCAAT